MAIPNYSTDPKYGPQPIARQSLLAALRNQVVLDATVKHVAKSQLSMMGMDAEIDSFEVTDEGFNCHFVNPFTQQPSSTLILDKWVTNPPFPVEWPEIEAGAEDSEEE